MDIVGHIQDNPGAQDTLDLVEESLADTLVAQRVLEWVSTLALAAVVANQTMVVVATGASVATSEALARLALTWLETASTSQA